MYLTHESIMPFGIYKGEKMKYVSPVYLYRMFVIKKGTTSQEDSIRDYFNLYYAVDEIAIHEAMKNAISLK